VLFTNDKKPSDRDEKTGAVTNAIIVGGLKKNNKRK
jgi:hypothetical protein